MNTNEFIRLIQNRVAEIAVNASTLRNQGGPGLIQAARNYFKELALEKFHVKNETVFIENLNSTTETLRKLFPPNAQHWGAARKAINLFLRDAFYNRYLHEYYKLKPIESWLEAPLDRYVATGLCKTPYGKCLPKWEAIKALTAVQSKKFQEVARLFAQEKGIARVHIDLLFWRQTSTNNA